jgi:phage terminase large subunit-like protein
VLRDEWPGVIELVDPKGSKIGRMHSVAHIFADGRVHLVRGPWVDRLKKVWTRFPKVKKDDEADAASQALRYLSKDERKLEALARVAATMRR